MIGGTVSVDREAVIPLLLIGPSGQTEQISAVIDTGFNGFLTLPATLTTLLGLPFHHEERALLADGEHVFLSVYAVKILWDGSTCEVLAMETGGDPLVGMALLEGYRLTLDAIDGGRVMIEALA
jgi:clan AA aspartic protease